MRCPSSIPVLLAVCCCLGGCVQEDGPSIYIDGAVILDDMCEATPSSTRLLRGVMNVQFRDAYTVYPVVSNQLLDRSSESPVRADSNIALITGAEVELQDAAGRPIGFGALPNPFTVATSVTVSSTEDRMSPTQVVGDVQVIPPAYARELDRSLGDDPLARSVVVVSVKLFGRTLGGVDVDADPWFWPVDLCRGRCLFDCSAAEDTENKCCFSSGGQDCEAPMPSSDPDAMAICS